MFTFRRRRVAIAFGLWLCAAAVAVDAAADAQQSYRDGVTAFSRKQWQKAVTAMRAAIAENPRESRSRVPIYGSWNEEYVPYYYLGAALVELRDCDAAIAAFATSQQQGVTTGIGRFATVVKTRGGCRETAAIAQVSPPAKEPAPAKELPPVPLPKASAPATTTAPADTASRPHPSELEAPAPGPPPPPPSASILPAQTVARPDPRAASALPPAATNPSTRDAAAGQRLAAAVDAYLSGRYDETTRLLDGVHFSDNAASAEAALFRAAGRYALFVIDGRKNDILRRQVKNDLREYRALHPGPHHPDPRIFAPPFIALAMER